MNLRQAAQQALEALENAYMVNSWAWVDQKQHVITALRAALAEPEQEPQTTHWEGCEAVHPECRKPDTDCHAQGICQRSGYSIAPAPRKPLTNEEISAILDDTLEGGSFFDVALAVARAIERAHGIGEQT